VIAVGRSGRRAEATGRRGREPAEAAARRRRSGGGQIDFAEAARMRSWRARRGKIDAAEIGFATEVEDAETSAAAAAAEAAARRRAACRGEIDTTRIHRRRCAANGDDRKADLTSAVVAWVR
jgi:hypothetical protein